MSDWWTYRISDFLLFSPETFYRLIELYNRDVWPLHLLMLLAAALLLVLVLRGSARWHSWVAASLLAATWLWVAWSFHLQRYTTINWAATWFASAFVLEALMLVWSGVFRDSLAPSQAANHSRAFGIVLYVYAVVIVPLLVTVWGRPWTQLELFGISPDPTVLATLGILLATAGRVRLWLLIIPLLWCAISGVTLHAMRAPDALALPIAGSLVLFVAIWQRVRNRKRVGSRQTTREIQH